MGFLGAKPLNRAERWEGLKGREGNRFGVEFPFLPLFGGTRGTPREN